MTVRLGKCPLLLVSWLSSGPEHHEMWKIWGPGLRKKEQERSVGADFPNFFPYFPMSNF